MRSNLQQIRRRDAAKRAAVLRGMPTQIPTNPADLDAAALGEGDEFQAVVAFDAHEVFRDEIDEDDVVIRLSRCSIDLPNGLAFDQDAVVVLAGKPARDMATRADCLRRRAFTISGRLSRRADGRGHYDLVAFAGTGPRTGRA